MHSKLISTICLLMLLIPTMPVFSHTGHVSFPHIHGGIELLIVIVIAAILYRITKH